MKLSTRLRLRCVAVWIARLLAGATFIISGWAKAIDPYGFVIKVEEYLAVWDIMLPDEAVVAACVTMACVEFLTGVLLATGSLKRTSALVALGMMAAMLPLTLYIAIANPVADCGCFGDFIILSNTATFVKNIILTAMIVYLVIYNRRVRGLYPAAIQWLVVAVSLAFPLFLALAGYQVQPLVDFRPYPIGTPIFGAGEDGNEGEGYFIYEKDDQQRAFALDEIPDSTWTFVEVTDTSHEGGDFGGGIAVLDSDGDDIASLLADDTSRQLFLIVPHPDMHYLIHAHYVERLSAFAQRTGVELIAIVGAHGVSLRRWTDWTRPDFDVYTADATALSQLVRGREAIVYTDGGVIRWKRTLRTLPQSLPDSSSAAALDNVPVVDDGRLHMTVVVVYLSLLFVIYLLGQSPKVVRMLTRLADRTRADKKP